MAEFAQFSAVRKDGGPPSVSVSLRPSKWEPPPEDCIKINVDVSLKDGVCFLGIVARNFWGATLRMQSFQETICDVEVAEACAALLALEWFCKGSWRKAIVESDSQVVVSGVYL